MNGPDGSVIKILLFNDRQKYAIIINFSKKVTTLKNYIAAGFSPAKLNLGFATYGRTQSVQGQYTREAGILC